MLAGEPPFAGLTSVVTRAHREQTPHDLRARAKKIPKRVWRNPAERPQTAFAFGSELRGQSEGVGAAPRSSSSSLPRQANNRRRVTINYYPTTSFSLPSDVYEYAANGTTVLRRTHTDYQLYSAYTDRRIIGLVFARLVYDGAGALQSKTRFHHDWAAPWLEERAGAKQHDDTNYGINFV
ncbi:MAG TPA: hypothetical protein VJM12_05205, partial [Pyrinomonadaceae bacterium]|nr:hypothetical protein [Pyrinomonadaceae bacterium]